MYLLNLMATGKGGPIQIFISYNWDEAQQKIVREIANKLKENFNVWIDIEKLVGESEEEMVKVSFFSLHFHK